MARRGCGTAKCYNRRRSEHLGGMGPPLVLCASAGAGWVSRRVNGRGLRVSVSPPRQLTSLAESATALASLFLVSVSLAAGAEAQVSRVLDETRVLAVIAAGGRVPRPVELIDRGGLFSGAGSGYRILLHTPESWVAERVARAMARGSSPAVSDIALEDRALFLRVIASPSPPTLGGSSEMSSSVERVLLYDEDREISLAPELAEPHTARHRRLVGSGSLTGMTALFSLAQVDALRGGQGEEFFVRVEGTGYAKDFKIKRKHLEELGW